MYPNLNCISSIIFHKRWYGLFICAEHRWYCVKYASQESYTVHKHPSTLFLHVIDNVVVHSVRIIDFVSYMLLSSDAAGAIHFIEHFAISLPKFSLFSRVSFSLWFDHRQALVLDNDDYYSVCASVGTSIAFSMHYYKSMNCFCAFHRRTGAKWRNS